MDYEAVIGLEVHAQLLTESKMFCSCGAGYVDAPPNSRVCPVCLGMPGVLPVINNKAVEYTIKTALALHCEIAEATRFDRKNYPYPDLMKGYQVSQYDLPLSRHGWLEIDVNGRRRRIGITRVHLEEDPAKLLHKNSEAGEGYSLVDVNRSGVPLMEIVGEPDMRSPEEARLYLMKLRDILRYLGVSNGDMEEGSFRCDANVSVRPEGSEKLPPAKVEVKNMNSFRSVFRALMYEVERQTKVLSTGGRIVQETRGWMEEKAVTVSQRTKEFAHDYRFFPEPDPPPLRISRQWGEQLRAGLPELPEARRDRFISQYGLSSYDAGLLVGDKDLADYFEECVALSSDLVESPVQSGLPQGRGEPAKTDDEAKRKAKGIGNWLLGDFFRLLNAAALEIRQAQVKPKQLVDLLSMLERQEISGPVAKAVLEEMFQSGRDPGVIVRERGLTQIGGAEELAPVIEQAIAAYAKAVGDFKAGKEDALKFLVGQVMKATRGRANPNLTADLLRKRLASR